MLATAATAAGLFTGTNIDDIVVLTLLVLVVRQGALTIWQVWLGQYVGVGALIILSLLAAAGLSVIPERGSGCWD